MIIKQIYDAICNLLWPEVCPFCECINKQGICDACKIKLKKLRIDAICCMKCGKPLSDETQEYCEECESVTRYFNQGISIWRHSDIVSKSLYCFKYQKKKRYAVFYIEEITPDTVKKLSWWKAQALVPVPLGKKRRRVRGYNQALLLAHALEERLGIPVVDCAVRIKETVPQKELSKKKRIENMHNAFKVNLKSPLKRVIIIDDIFTTGSTVDAIATELKKEGVEEVFFLTISIGQGN